MRKTTPPRSLAPRAARRALQDASVALLSSLVAALLLLDSCATIEGPRLYPLPASVTFAGENVPLGESDAYERIWGWYNYFLSRPWVVEVWLQRARSIFPFIDAELRNHRLPLDLRYLAVAESSLDPRATSPSGAGGIWQFMPGTAALYGLRIDRFVDERYDYLLETRAALSYFENARRELGGSWFLVCAAYNLGITAIKDRVERQGSTDYWSMVFPPQTDEYVPKIIAIKLIMENARSLGFAIPTEKADRAVRLTLATVDNPIYLSDIASATGLPFRQVWLLNPQIKGLLLPPGSYDFYLPERFASKRRILNDYLNGLPYERETFVVKKGDTLFSTARALGTTVDELESINDLKGSATLAIGAKLLYWRRVVAEGYNQDQPQFSGRGR